MSGRGKLSRESTAATEIHASFDGIITNKYVKEGSLISSSNLDDGFLSQGLIRDLYDTLEVAIKFVQTSPMDFEQTIIHEKVLGGTASRAVQSVVVVRAGAGRVGQYPAKSDNLAAVLYHTVGFVQRNNLTAHVHGQFQPVPVVHYADWLFRLREWQLLVHERTSYAAESRTD